MEKPKILTTECLLNGFFDVYQDMLEKSDGKKIYYSHCVLPSDAVVILAETKEGKLVLNREYRHPTKSYLLGLPGGTLNPNEDPIEGGQRELLEETGYFSDKIEMLGVSYPLPAICNQKIYFLWAKNSILKSEPQREAFELIHLELQTEEEIQKNISSKMIFDGLLLTALSFRRWKLSSHSL